MKAEKRQPLREVEEECGLGSLTLGNFFDTTYHLYERKRNRSIKGLLLV